MSHIRTTHVGSLPRPEALTQLMYAHQEGKTNGELEAAVSAAVREIVDMQLRAGIDVISDGEMGKPGFVNYVGERLTGFGGQAAPWTISDLADAPELLIEQYGGEAGAHIMPANCEGAVTYTGHALLQRDIDNLRAALDGREQEAFMPSASPGVVAVCSPNLYYPDYDAYIDAVADAMAEEYRAIVDAGLLLQLDCPDIPMAAHTEFWCKDQVDKLGLEGFATRNVAAIDRALAGIDPSRVRLHMCWGNYEGPHHLDAPLRELIGPVLAGRPGDDLLRSRQPAPRARVGGVRDARRPGREDPAAGRHRHADELRRAPAAGRTADRALRPVRRPGAGDRQRRLRLRHLRRLRAGRRARGGDEAGGARGGRQAGGRLMRLVSFELATVLGPLRRTGALAGDTPSDR